MEIIKEKKNKITINSENFEKAKQLFDILKIPYIIAPDEAEKLCSKLCIQGIVSAVLSEDTDVIAYGSPLFFTKINTFNETVVVLSNNNIRNVLNLTQNQLLEFCIMCGTDYNNNIPNIGPAKAYKKNY